MNNNYKVMLILTEKKIKVHKLYSAKQDTDYLSVSAPWQWRRRSVVKYGGHGQSGQAIKLFQITPCVNDFQTPKQLWRNILMKVSFNMSW